MRSRTNRRAVSFLGSQSKGCCTKHLFELKPEELPCPAISREMMASEQPSSRHENARMGGGTIWFRSSAKAVQAGRSVLAAATLLPLLFVFFT